MARRHHPHTPMPPYLHTPLLLLAFLLAPAACRAHPAVGSYTADLQAASAAVRRHAAASLGRLGDRAAVPALAKALADPDAGVRREAAKALGNLKDARAAEPLRQALRDSDAGVRANSAYALGEIRDSSAANALLDALADPEWGVRDQAAWALRELHDPKIAAPLVALLGKGNADTAHVTWILREMKDPAVVSALAAMLRAPDTLARIRAAGALGEMKSAGATEALLGALGDPEAKVRLAVVEALTAVGDEPALEALRRLAATEKDPSVQQALAKVPKSPLQEALAGHWSFDDGTAKDVTGRGNDGEVKGCTPAPGKVGQALRFGKEHYVELGQPPAFRMGGHPITVMAWAKSDARNGVVVARGGAFCGFSLYLKEGLPRFGIHLVQDGPTFIAAGREEAVGRWVHLAGVVRQDRIELYVDGKLAATEKTAGLIPGEAGQGMEIGFDAGNSPAEITDAFEGLIDEVKVFEMALGEADIAREMAAR